MTTSDPVALISAGASGIGLYCARALSSEGYSPMTIDIESAHVETFQKEFGEESAVVCDVSDPKQVEVAFDKLTESCCQIDVLINNAGISGPLLPVEEIKVEDWNRTIDTNLRP